MASSARPSGGDASGTPAGAAAVSVPPPHDGMRRLQIGVAGVIMVLLLVGLAGVASDRARDVVGGAEAGQEIVPPVITNSAPLEELGVQPVAKDAAAGGTASVILPPEVAVQPRATVPDLEPDPELARARQAKN